MPSLVEQLVEQYRDRFATVTQPPFTPSEEAWSQSWDGTVGESAQYAARFLTFVYQVPFRLLAVQQELMDVYAYHGKATPEFLQKFAAWSGPQRLAFRSLLIEHQRLSLLGQRFQAVDRIVTDRDLNLEDKAALFVQVHEEVTDEWNRLLTEVDGGKAPGCNAVSHAKKGSILPPRSAAGRGAGAQLALPFLPEMADMAETKFVRDVAASPRSARRQAAAEGAFSFYLSREDRAAFPKEDPDLGETVLEALAEREIREAERRFQMRVRWIVGLPRQQRTVTAHRAVGRKRRETAEIMGISDESVKTHLQRADAEWDRLEAALQKTERIKGPVERRAPDAPTAQRRPRI